MATDFPRRKAVRWVTYPGRVDLIPPGEPGSVVGPNTTNEYLTMVSADHDPVSDTTRVGFAYGLPEDTPAFTIRQKIIDFFRPGTAISAEVVKQGEAQS